MTERGSLCLQAARRRGIAFMRVGHAGEEAILQANMSVRRAGRGQSHAGTQRCEKILSH